MTETRYINELGHGVTVTREYSGLGVTIMKEKVIRCPILNNLHGLLLLPEDVYFIKRCLDKLGLPHNDTNTLSTYHTYWQTAMDAQPLEHRKDNAGRFAANTWIRVLADGK